MADVLVLVYWCWCTGAGVLVLVYWCLCTGAGVLVLLYRALVYTCNQVDTITYKSCCCTEPGAVYTSSACLQEAPLRECVRHGDCLEESAGLRLAAIEFEVLSGSKCFSPLTIPPPLPTTTLSAT